MVQKGRGFRAAQPRAALDWEHYSQRPPRWLRLRGEFNYLLGFVSVPDSAHVMHYNFFPSPVEWNWGGTFLGGLLPFGWDARLRPNNVDGGFTWELLIQDLIGGELYNLWALPWPFGVFASGTWLFGHTPATQTATGNFAIGRQQWFDALAYADEPP